MRINLITCLLRIAGFVVLAMAANAGAQESAASYPSRLIRLISSGVVGGLTDNTGRVLAEQLRTSPELNGQAVIIENKAGASGNIATMAVASAAPDGYTLLVADIGQTSINPALDAKTPYDTLRDFVPISRFGIMPFFLSVNSSLGVSNLRELVALAKRKPGELSYGSSGAGSVHHLATETLKTVLGLDMVHIPYKGSAQTTPAMIGGQIEVMFTLLAPMAPYIKTGKVKLIAVAGAARSPQAPDVPTFAELGVKDMVFVPSVSVLAPAATPRPIVAKIGAEIVKAMRHPDLLKRFERLGIDPLYTTPDEYAALLRADMVSFARAVKLSGAKAE